MFARPPSLPSCLYPAVSPSKNRRDRYAVMTSAEEFEIRVTAGAKQENYYHSIIVYHLNMLVFRVTI